MASQLGNSAVSSDGAINCASITQGAPRTRQRLYKPPPSLEIPDIDQDAAERKRVLNVLAQRRYRERRRHAKKTGKSEKESEALNVRSESAECSASPDTLIAEPAGMSSQPDALQINHPGVESISHDLEIPEVDEAIDMNIDDAWPSGSLVTPNFSNMMLASVPMNTFGAFDVSAEPSSSASTSTRPTQRTTVSPAALLEDSSSSASTASFPDSYLIPVNELSLLRAILRIAERINCQNFWGLDSESPFFRGIATPANQLPRAWRPTQSQLLVSHHPFIDFLPWPGVRERIIGIMGLDDDIKPASAVGPLGMVNFAYDVEDSAEGVRIWGGDVYDPSSWEVGQVLFERWWFLFDREIIENSNRWRRLRGAPTLRLNRPGMGN